jgi:hypothetical protein
MYFVGPDSPKPLLTGLPRVESDADFIMTNVATLRVQGSQSPAVSARRARRRPWLPATLSYRAFGVSTLMESPIKNRRRGIPARHRPRG